MTGLVFGTSKSTAVIVIHQEDIKEHYNGRLNSSLSYYIVLTWLIFLHSPSSPVGTSRSSLLGGTFTGTWPTRASSIWGTSCICPQRLCQPPSAGRLALRLPVPDLKVTENFDCLLIFNQNVTQDLTFCQGWFFTNFWVQLVSDLDAPAGEIEQTCWLFNLHKGGYTGAGLLAAIQLLVPRQ